MARTKSKVQMPAGIRNKLMAAVSMLLVSCIMLVSSTYAWFTLSTAPEVTGITTSVGANGNLEMALLTSGKGTEGEEGYAPNTFADTSLITSAVGDSSAATNDVTKSNITWGNLVDLSHQAYHLSDVKLMPAAANISTDAATLDITNLLQTAVYGADGRVDRLNANTVSGVFSNNAWDASNTTYGVRAVGVASSMSAKEMGYNTAKSAYKSNLVNAHSGMNSAINNNLAVLATLSGDAAITQDQKNAALEVVNGASSDLNTLIAAYKNLIIAKAATVDSLSDTDFTTLKTVVSSLSAAELGENANTYSSYLPSGAAVQIKAVADMIDEVASAKTKVTEAVVGTTKGSELKASISSVVGTNPSMSDISGSETYYWIDGVLGTIAGSVGTYVVVSKPMGLNITIYGGAENTPAVLTASSIPNKEFTNGGSASINDTYGYVLDFAFRTNASGSNLQLQTSAINRVYQDVNSNTDLATQGSGSTAEFTIGSGLTSSQAVTLLKTIKFVFFDPDTGAIYATAATDGATVSDDGSSVKANIKMKDQTGDAATIVAMQQNMVKKVSVLVYMDGATVDNADVANATSSGTLKLNLQFSSSVTLNPMTDTNLKSMQKTTTTTPGT